MKKCFLIIFTLFACISKSQQWIGHDVLDVSCINNNSGAVFLDLSSIVGNQVDYWEFQDDSLGWILADTMLAVNLSLNSDTLFTQQCGDYQVSVSGIIYQLDFMGCPLGSMGEHMNVKCSGEATGRLVRVAHSGNPFPNGYYYNWYKDSTWLHGGINDTIADFLEAGSYKVNFTDANGCTDSITSIISSPNKLIFDTIFVVDVNCRGVNAGKITFNVSGGREYVDLEPYDYYIIDLISSDTISWANHDSISSNFSIGLNADSIIFDSLYAGQYILAIVDSFTCHLDTIFEIKEPANYIAFGSAVDILVCESDSGYLKIDSVVVDTALGSDNIAYGFDYDIINGIYIDSIYAISGWYDIYVYDSIYFCLDTVPIIFESLYQIEVIDSVIPVRCYGEQSGRIIIDSIYGGNAPYDVQWGGIDSSALYAGEYLVYIVDSINCLHTEVYIISSPDEIHPNPILYSPLCYGDSTGSISINVTGGSDSLSYQWSNGLIVDSLFGLFEIMDTLIVTDLIDSCINEFTFDFALLTPFEVNLIASDSSLSFFGDSTMLNVMISGGMPPYIISWSDLNDTNQQRVVGAGNYEVYVTDANGCMISDSILIVEPPPLVVDIELLSDMTCVEGAVVSASVSGGVPPYTYLWGGAGGFSDTTAIIDSLFYEGTYTVVVSDALGIFVMDIIYVASYALDAVVYYDTATHIAEVEILSSTSQGPFSYEWFVPYFSLDCGNVNLFPSYDSISPYLCDNCEYRVITTDLSTGCTVVDTIKIDFNLNEYDIFFSETTIVDTINLPNIWGVYPYTYNWSTLETTAYGHPCPDSDFPWYVEISDIYGCYQYYDIILQEIVVSLEPSSAIIECNLENLDVELEASAEGGTGSFTFIWWGDTINPVNLGMNPGIFNLSVVDANGCSVDTSFVIATMTAECIPNVFSPNGDDINDYWSLEDTFLYADSEVRVYGRFGNLLFKSIGYHIPWDGTNQKGNAVPDGAYFYCIDIGHGFDQIFGTVTILR